MPLKYFMMAFMYVIEKELNHCKDELKNLPFQSDEANPDRPLKEYLKNKIEEKLSAIPESYYSQQLQLITDDDHTQTISFEAFKDFRIEKVYLREEIPDELKKKLKKEKENAVYTNPDLLLEIRYDNEEIAHQKIELKSTKNNSIPGSSIQQINPDEWVIFVKHTSRSVDVTTGQYINAINAKMRFPDRSPRPQVSFRELKNWNQKNRAVQDSTVICRTDTEATEKRKLVEDWQQVLASRWINLLLGNPSVKKSEPWFHDTMRKFILMFLGEYDTFTPEEKDAFKSKIKTLIQK